MTHVPESESADLTRSFDPHGWRESYRIERFDPATVLEMRRPRFGLSASGWFLSLMWPAFFAAFLPVVILLLKWLHPQGDKVEGGLGLWAILGLAIGVPVGLIYAAFLGFGTPVRVRIDFAEGYIEVARKREHIRFAFADVSALRLKAVARVAQTRHGWRTPWHRTRLSADLRDGRTVLLVETSESPDVEEGREALCPLGSYLARRLGAPLLVEGAADAAALPGAGAS